MPNKNWSKLSPLQLGKYAEYLSKMEFASYGFEIYSSEVDDQGVDFIIKLKDNKQMQYCDIQVKSIRDLKYIFFPKDKFQLRDNLFAAVIIFIEGSPPYHFLIPSRTWESPNLLFVSRDYVHKKSKPEWGLNISIKNLSLLSVFSFNKTIKAIWPELIY